MKRSNKVVSECVKHERQKAGQTASKRGEQGRRLSELCRASPERGGGLGGGPFVGEVAGEDSLSFATSSPTCTNTHTDSVRDSEGSALQKVKFVRQKRSDFLHTGVTSEIEVA